MGANSAVEMTRHDAEAQAPASSSDGNAMIGKGSKSARNYGQLGWLSSVLPWVLTIIFLATTIVFVTLYAVELDDDDSCNKGNIKEVQDALQANANQIVVQEFMEGITSGNETLLNLSLSDDVELRCDISFGCPYETKAVVIQLIGTPENNFGDYINETWQQFSESIEWIPGAEIVVAHFSTHSHGPDDDDHDDDDVLEGSIHGTFVFHLKTYDNGPSLITGVDYYEAKEYSEMMVTNVEALVFEFLLAIQTANITMIQSFITDDFVFYCDYSWCPLDQNALLAGVQDPNQEWVMYIGNAWQEIQSNIEYFEGASLVGGAWDFGITVLDGEDQTSYTGSFIFPVSNTIQNGIKLSSGYFYENNGGFFGLDVVGRRFMEASVDGEGAKLESLLADDFVFFCDFPDCPVNRTSYIQSHSGNQKSYWAGFFKESWAQIEPNTQWHFGEDTIIVDWNFTPSVPFNKSWDKSPPAIKKHYGSYVIHCAISGENKGKITDVTYFEWNVESHIAYRNQFVAEQFMNALDTGEVGNLTSIVSEDFLFYCDFPGCPFTIDDIETFFSPNNSISTWFNISFEDLKHATEWSRDNKVVTAHWNYTTPPILAPWEANLPNLQPYPHHFHGARVFHFDETNDINNQALIVNVFQYEWDESDYWGEVNKQTARAVVRHMADGNVTALDDLLAEDFALFCDHVFCPANKTNFLNWFSDQNHTLSSIFSQNASTIVDELEWAEDNLLVLAHFNITIDGYPFHGAYVFHFKSSTEEPFVGNSMKVSDFFYYEWQNSNDLVSLFSPFVEQIGSNATADTASLGDYLHEDWIGAIPSTDSTILIDKPTFISQSLEDSGLRQACLPEDITFYTEYFFTEEDVPPGLRFTAMHHIVFLDENGQNVTEVAEESHHVIYYDQTGFAEQLLDNVKELYYDPSSYSSGFVDGAELNIIRSWWFTQSEKWNCLHTVGSYVPPDIFQT